MLKEFSQEVYIMRFVKYMLLVGGASLTLFLSILILTFFFQLDHFCDISFLLVKKKRFRFPVLTWIGAW